MVRYFLDYEGRTVACETTSFSALDALKQAQQMAFDNPNLHYFAIRRRDGNGQYEDKHTMEVEVRPISRLGDARVTEDANEYEHLACNLFKTATFMASISHE